jgi:8-oxo-dGTP diphosphatase
MTGSPQKQHYIAAAVMWHDDEILLVEQQGPGDEVSAWALPGGRAEPGELLHEALIREVKEETGLDVTELGQLLYLVQTDNPNKQQIMENFGPGDGYRATAVVFEVTSWEGILESADPDNFILDVRFWPVLKAITLLEQTLHYRVMREPLLAYLRGEASAGSTWFYRRRPDNHDELLFVSKIR